MFINLIAIEARKFNCADDIYFVVCIMLLFNPESFAS